MARLVLNDPRLRGLVFLALAVGIGNAPATAQIVTTARPSKPMSRAVPQAAGWVRHLGGRETDAAHDLALHAHGGAIVCGRSASGPREGVDAWVARLSEHGATLWQRTLGGPGLDDAASVCALPDGGCLVAGRTSSFGAGGTDGWLARLDGAGDVVWMRTYGTAADEHFNALSAAPSGEGFYVGGVLTDPHTGLDAWVLKVDGAGEILWQQRFAGDRDEGVTGLDTTLDGGVVLAANSNSLYGLPEGPTEPIPFFRPFVVRLSAAGAVVSQRTYNHSGGDAFRRIVALDDGGYVAVGEILAMGFFRGDLWVVRFDQAGVPLWDRRLGDHFGNNYVDSGVAVEPTSDGGFAVLASTGTAGAGSEDLWFARFDAEGALLADTTLGGPGFDQAADLALLPDGTAWIAGQVQLGVGADTDALVVRMLVDGDTGGCDLAGATGAQPSDDALEVDEVHQPGVPTTVVPALVIGVASRDLAGGGGCPFP